MRELRKEIAAGVVVAIVAAAALASATFLLSRDVNPLSTTTGTNQSAGSQETSETMASTSNSTYSTQEVMNDFLHHLMQVQSKNVSAIASDYEDSAVLEWEGDTSGFGGTYHGLANITAGYDGILPRLSGLTLTNVTGVASYSGSMALIDGSFNISWAFNSATNGCPANVSNMFDGQVDVAISYTPSVNGWLISNEIWNFQTPTSSGICA